MKKLAILLGAVIMSGTLLAQKPSSDDSNYSLEGMINYSDAGFEWNAPNLRMRYFCLLYTSPSPRDLRRSRMPSSA